MSVMDRIKKESAKRFSHHPVGDYPGTIAEVKLKEVNGSDVYEIAIQTKVGVAQASIWKNRFEEIAAVAKRNNKSIEDQTNSYFEHMGRIYRLYEDLGLEPPTGETEVEFEKAAYGRLGEWKGRPCMAKVVANKRDASKGPVVYINRLAEGSAAPAPTSAFEGGQPGGVDLSDIPF